MVLMIVNVADAGSTTGKMYFQSMFTRSSRCENKYIPKIRMYSGKFIFMFVYL